MTSVLNWHQICLGIICFGIRNTIKRKLAASATGYPSGYIMPDNGRESDSTDEKTPQFKELRGSILQKVTPTGTGKSAIPREKQVVGNRFDNKSDNTPDEIRLIQAFRRLGPDDQRRIVDKLESDAGAGRRIPPGG